MISEREYERQQDEADALYMAGVYEGWKHGCLLCDHEWCDETEKAACPECGDEEGVSAKRCLIDRNGNEYMPEDYI